MPAAWISAAAGVYGAYENSQKSGGGSGGPTNAFNGPNTSMANSDWASGMGGLQDIAQSGYSQANPAFLQSLNAENSINYAPWQTAANQAGSQYGNLAQQSLGQAQQYGSAANQVYQRAFDPNQAQYNQTAQMLGSQVDAGQAARGLGNSPVGGAEYNDAMSNFNAQWNAQQLQNEATGMSAMGQGLTAQNLAGQQAAGYLQQAGQVPIQAQQYIAGQPAANASNYVSQLGGLGSLFGNVTGQALPYITGGQGAQQYNTGYNTQQNTANMNLLTQGAQGIANQYNTPGSWLSNMFSSQPNYGTTNQQNTAQSGGFAGVEDYGT